MLSRSWLRIAALGGCLIGLYGSPGHTQTNPSQPDQQSDQQEREAFLARNGVVQTAIYEADCHQPANHDAADYCQQIRMAKAAEDAVWWARLQTFLGIFGLAGVVGTLIYTARATDAASKSAIAAEKAIIVENRPWIKIVSIEVCGDPVKHSDGILFPCRMVLTNIGNGPAKIIGIGKGEVDIARGDYEGDFHKWIAEHVEIAKRHPTEQETVFPEETYQTFPWALLTNARMDAELVFGDDQAKTIIPHFVFGVFYQAAIDPSILYTVATYIVTKPGGSDESIPLDGSKIEGKTLRVARFSGLSRSK